VPPFSYRVGVGSDVSVGLVEKVVGGVGVGFPVDEPEFKGVKLRVAPWETVAEEVVDKDIEGDTVVAL
jgi:hypothetical protein